MSTDNARVPVGMDLQQDKSHEKARGMLQCGRDILKEGGVAAFFQGWWAQVVALGASNFIYFYANSALKLVMRTRYGARACLA